MHANPANCRPSQLLCNVFLTYHLNCLNPPTTRRPSLLQAVQPGLCVSPQLAAKPPPGGLEEVVRRHSGRPFRVDTKFDGWRIQV